MANCILAWRNWIDESGVALSASSALSSLPINNLANPILAKVYRSSSSVSPTIDIDLGAARAAGVLGLFGHNLASGDTIRHMLSAVSAGGSELLDTGAVASGAQEGYAQSVKVLAASVNARYWRIEVNAPSLSPTPGYVEIGRAFIAAAWQPSRNFSFGSGEKWTDASLVAEAERSGAEYIDLGPRRRERSFALEFMSAADRDQSRELDRLAGLTGQVLFIPDPNSADLQREAILGRLKEMSPIEVTHYSVFSRSFAIVESK